MKMEAGDETGRNNTSSLSKLDQRTMENQFDYNPC